MSSSERPLEGDNLSARDARKDLFRRAGRVLLVMAGLVALSFTFLLLLFSILSLTSVTYLLVAADYLLTLGTGGPGLMLFFFGRQRISIASASSVPMIQAAPPLQEVAVTVEKPKKTRAKRQPSFSISALLARKVSQRLRVMTFAASAVAAFIAIMIVTFVYPTYFVRPSYDDAMVLIFIFALLPPSLLDIVARSYQKQIDMRIPDFLREIAESQRTGVPFTKSLTLAAAANYGPLTKELRQAMAKMALGSTFEEALDDFAESADTPLSHRSAVLLKEVGRAGGKMLEVLDSVYEHIREVTTLQKERSKQLSPYVMIIYASFGVYIFVVYILFSTFFAQIASLVSSGAPFGTNINPTLYFIWFYHMSIIEAVFGGLVAGKISAGTVAAGLKHVLVLLTISFVAFAFFIPV